MGTKNRELEIKPLRLVIFIKLMHTSFLEKHTRFAGIELFS